VVESPRYLLKSLSSTCPVYVVDVYKLCTQMAPKKEIAGRKIGQTCGPRNVTMMRDDVISSLRLNL
jgi:hypothetical protein